jgi:hypothetical protein
MKNKTDLNWSDVNYTPQDVFTCKLPVQMILFDDVTVCGKADSFILKVKSFFTLFKQDGWWNERQFNVKMSYLVDLEKIAQWYLDNANRLNSNKEFRARWVGKEIDINSTLLMVNVIKNNLKTLNTKKIHEFPSVAHFYYFGYNACRTMGAGYHFRELEKDFPISFSNFKYIQNISKIIVNASVEMNHTYINVKEKETDKWLM